MDSPVKPPLEVSRGEADLAEFLYDPVRDGPQGGALNAGEQRVLRELLVFDLGAEEFAVDVPRVQEILIPPPLSEVPRCRSDLLGVTMIRGDVVPVFDIRSRLDLPASRGPSLRARVIVVLGPQGPFGVWVDGVSAVVRLTSESLETPPRGISGEGGPVSAIGRQGDRIFAVLSIDSILGSQA